MLPLDEITEIELHGYASGDLLPAYEALLDRWRSTQDRETGLRLLFLSWYATAEPEINTGLEVDDAPVVAAEVVSSLDTTLTDDVEFLHVAIHMISLCPWAFDGSARTWKRQVRAYRKEADRFGEAWSRPETFAGRGAYGAYFAHIARRWETAAE